MSRFRAQVRGCVLTEVWHAPGDVCARDVGTGNLVPKDPKQRLTFGIEILCTSCGDKYRRCSGELRSSQRLPRGILTPSLLQIAEGVSCLRVVNLPCQELTFRSIFSGGGVRVG